MSLERQVIDTATGEVKSRGYLGENQNFVMLFRNEISSIVNLQKEDAKAGVLFMFLLEHMDRENALIVSIETISELLEWSRPTVCRKIKFLKEKNFITTARTGNSSIYFVNANIAWSTYGNKKEYAKGLYNAIVQYQDVEEKNLSEQFMFESFKFIEENYKEGYEDILSKKESNTQIFIIFKNVIMTNK